MPRKSVKDAAPQVEALAVKPKPKTETTKDRSWETAQRHNPETTQVSYRGIPRVLNQRMNEIAQEYGCSVSTVARSLLEAGLEAYEDGGVKIGQAPESSDRTASG